LDVDKDETEESSDLDSLVLLFASALDSLVLLFAVVSAEKDSNLTAMKVKQRNHHLPTKKVNRRMQENRPLLET
jgi:hypothetical protein